MSAKSRHNLLSSLPIVFVLLGACATTQRVDTGGSTQVVALLDAWHRDASEADESEYFRRFAPTGVFLGTDAAERWPTAEFREWARPHFARGKAWTFRPGKRNVMLSRDGNVAWFDELLQSDSYGVCRGTGVFQRYDGEWKLEQYHLTIPMPNDLAKEFVDKIREHEAKASPR